MAEWMKLLAYALLARFESRARLQAENLVLRQQIKGSRGGRSCLRQAFFPRTLPRKMSAGSQMDMPKSRTENFDRFLPSAAAVGILRVHDRARIAPHAPISSLLHDVGKHAGL